MKIDTAVVPIAGLGTRLLPLTRLVPKEFLPVGSKSAIQLIVEELYCSGIHRFVFVASPGKPSVAPLFDGNWHPDNSPSRCPLDITTVIQAEQNGLGDAVRCAQKAVEDRPFVVALGDCLIGPTAGGTFTNEILTQFGHHKADVVIGFVKVPDDAVSHYGVAKPGYAISDDQFIIDDLIEKPSPESAPSNYAISGRYCLSPAVFSELQKTAPGASGEIQLTDAIASLIRNGAKAIGILLPDHLSRYDIGNAKSYVQTFVEFALSDPELRESVGRGLLGKDILNR